jgi:hypothetical protein
LPKKLDNFSSCSTSHNIKERYPISVVVFAQLDTRASFQKSKANGSGKQTVVQTSNLKTPNKGWYKVEKGGTYTAYTQKITL